MSNSPPTPHPSRFDAQYKWLAGTLAVVFLRALPNLRYLIGRDQATYCVIGQGLLRGQLLYRDLWDNKPPGIFYIYALIVKIFGPVMWSVGFVDILWLLVFSCCLFYFTRRYLGNLGASLSVIFYACRHCYQGYIHAAQPEAFLMLGIFAAWFLLGGSSDSPPPNFASGRASYLGRHFLVGLILGAAFWMKYNAVAFFPFLAFLPYVDFGGLNRSRVSQLANPQSPIANGILKSENEKSKVEDGDGQIDVRNPESGIRNSAPASLHIETAEVQMPDPNLATPSKPSSDFRSSSFLGLRLLIPWKDWFARMLLVSAGAIFALIAVLVSFRLSGAWPAMKEIQFVVLPRYAAMSIHWSFYYVYWALWQTQNHMGTLWEAVVAVALLIALWRGELGRIAPLAFMALAGYISTAMQGRFHPYYFETSFPFFAMFWGYVGVKTFDGFQFLQRICVQRRWSLVRGLLWVVLASLILTFLPEEGVRVVQQYRFAADWWRDPEASYKSYYWQLPLEKIGDQMRVVDYLKVNSSPQDQVFVWGTAPLINFLSQRQWPSRFVSNLGVMSTWVPESWRQELARTLAAKRPRYLVVERHDMVPTLTFTAMDSEEYLQVYPALASLLQSQYAPAANYYDFEVYEIKGMAEVSPPGHQGTKTPRHKVRRGLNTSRQDNSALMADAFLLGALVSWW